MSWKRALAGGVTELYSLKHRKAPAAGLRILLYHAVGSTIDGDALGLSLEAEVFGGQMAALKRYGNFEIVPLAAGSLAQASPHPSLSPGRGEGRGEGRLCRVAVTFDDGYRDNLTAAAPILAGLGIPFTVFVVPAYVRSGGAPYLTLAQLKSLAEFPGCSIGSHGMNHRRLAGLGAAELKAELEGSRRWLEDAVGRPVEAVSYPHGSADRRVRDAAEAAGYRLGVCSRTGVNGAGRDPLLLCRTEITAFDGARRFKQKLYGGWDWHRFRHKDPARA